MIVGSSRMQQADAAVRDAWIKRQTTYLLADELRQSSDDLTRLARIHVPTDDAAREAQDMAILAIRNRLRHRRTIPGPWRDFHRHREARPRNAAGFGNGDRGQGRYRGPAPACGGTERAQATVPTGR
ncbi:MAG TPA: hypothetical protein ENN83_13550 [Rhodovulum sp.]|nr:hypothetical protein [Rhodovulum sp.]